MQPVHKLVNDTDSAVRLELVDQLPHVAMICQEAPDRFGNVLSNHLIHIIVRQSTHNALLALIERGLLDKHSVEHVVAPTLLMMGAQPAKLEFINFAIDGMSKVASLLDPETAERLFLERYLSLCTDVNFFIRKLCAIHFGEFSTSMTKETMYEKMLPMYVNLCKDSVWTVRKSCAEVIVSIACCVPVELRRTTLSDILASHLEDESKWVRLSAYQMLGPFISTFAKKFTGIAYNHYGELILTDQHGTELRYNMISFAGSIDSSMSCKASSDEDYEQDNEMLNNSGSKNSNNSMFVESKTVTTRRTSRSGYRASKVDTLNKFYDEFQKHHQSIEDNSLLNESSKNLWNSMVSLNEPTVYDDLVPEEHHQFNSFLYYYIPPPDLPLLDGDLIQPSNDSSAEDNSIHPDKSPKESADDRTELVNNSDSNTQVEVTVEDSSADAKQRSFIRKHSSDDNHQTIVPQELINLFVSMADPEAWWNLKWNSAEIPRFCAFYFPAVVLTLGKENWPMLKTAYGYLSDAREYKVRRTMASSIHEVAIILGEELAAQDLLPIYDGFIKDLDEVRIGALKHLATFLKVLKPADRCHFLPRLQAFLSIDNDGNWRFREEVACRLLEAVTLYTPQDVAKHIAPLSFPLLVDKVAAVRQMALELVTQIVSYLSSDETLVTTIIQQLEEMLTANSSRWTCRQTFALLCASLISKDAISGERFANELLPSLLELSTDVVPNVRLAVVRTLTTQVVNISNILSEEQVKQINDKVRNFRQDPDRDVRALAGGSVGKYQACK
ncbi:Similar to Ppp4r1: Serine/threonine-protein phosphatase 4 regulatory subunit 1 (Rattus norvegicus), partial [Cotesia congregata]